MGGEFWNTRASAQTATFAQVNEKTRNMDNKDYIRLWRFDQIEERSGQVDYMGEGIAFHTDFKEQPIEDGSLRMDMVVIVGCAQGKMQGELNAVSYTIR